MHADEFINEVHQSSNCPEDFDKVYSEFQFYQKLTDDTLREFHRVCEKNGISYQLAYGSLLGAVRDNGQIPWDYDADAFVDFHDKDRLINCLKRDLSDQYYFYCPETDSHCRHVFIRISPKNYRSEELHVDVFYLTGAPGGLGTDEMHQYAERIRNLCDARYYKLVKPLEACHGNWKYALLLYLKKIQYLPKSTKSLYSEYLRLAGKYDRSSASAAVTPDTFCGDDRWCFDYRSIWDTRLIQTDLGEFRIPVHYDGILKTSYGDYLSYAPLEDRIAEMYKHHARLTKYARQ